MTTTPPTIGPRSDPNRMGVNDIDAKAKTKAKSEANKEKKKRRKQKGQDKINNNNNNNNYVKFNGLITEGNMEVITISPVSSARMKSEFLEL